MFDSRNQKVLEQLTNNKDVKEAYFGYQEFNDNDVDSIVIALRQNDYVHSINVKGINGEDALIKFAKFLRDNPRITYVDFGHNRVTDQSIALFFETLGENHSIISLKLYNNKIGCEGAMAIAQWLERSKSLKYIDLTSNQIKDKGIEYISNALTINTSLISIKLAYNLQARAGYAAFANALKMNPFIMHFTIGMLNMDSNIDTHSLAILEQNIYNMGNIFSVRYPQRSHQLDKMLLERRMNMYTKWGNRDTRPIGFRFMLMLKEIMLLNKHLNNDTQLMPSDCTEENINYAIQKLKNNEIIPKLYQLIHLSIPRDVIGYIGFFIMELQLQQARLPVMCQQQERREISIPEQIFSGLNSVCNYIGGIFR